MLGFTGNYNESLRNFIETREKREFKDIESFIEYCNKNCEDKLNL